MKRKTALVTGASSDIGRTVAECLARAGYNIGAHYFNNADQAQQLKERITQHGVEVALLRYDLTHPAPAGDMIAETLKKFGGLDVLVNVIGPSFRHELFEVTPQEWADSVIMNLNVAFNVSYFARAPLIASKGHIVNFAFAGVELLKSYPLHTSYCAAKAGIVILTKSLAASLAPLGVRVNAVSPGLIETGATTDAKRREYARQIPAGRPGRPEEIGEVVRWLVQDSPAYITGALIPVAGAWEFLG